MKPSDFYPLATLLAMFFGVCCAGVIYALIKAFKAYFIFFN